MFKSTSFFLILRFDITYLKKNRTTLFEINENNSLNDTKKF